MEVHGGIVIEGEPLTDFSKMQVSLSALDGTWLSDIRTKINNDGSFVLADVAPGNYDVRLSGSAEAWVKSVGLGLREAVERRIEVTESDIVAPLQITLSRSLRRLPARSRRTRDGLLEAVR